jgi:hypothetical protein
LAAGAIPAPGVLALATSCPCDFALLVTAAASVVPVSATAVTAPALLSGAVQATEQLLQLTTTHPALSSNTVSVFFLHLHNWQAARDATHSLDLVGEKNF